MHRMPNEGFFDDGGCCGDFGPGTPNTSSYSDDGCDGDCGPGGSACDGDCDG